MTKSVGVHEAKTHLSRLLDDVAAGVEVLITRRGAPAARLVAARRGAGRPPRAHQSRRGASGNSEASNGASPDLNPEEAERRAERIRTIVADAAKRWAPAYRDADHGDLLYDERGLPRDRAR